MGFRIDLRMTMATALSRCCCTLYRISFIDFAFESVFLFCFVLACFVLSFFVLSWLVLPFIHRASSTLPYLIVFLRTLVRYFTLYFLPR